MRAGLCAVLLMGCFKPALPRDVVEDSVDTEVSVLDEIAPNCGVDGAECDDGDPCTSGDRCASGGCVGIALECASVVCKKAGVCSPADGQCHYQDELDGAACDDGDRCTAADRCVAGTCTASRAADDTLFDFAVWYGGQGGNRVAGLANLGREVAVLVEFPIDTELEEPTLTMGASTSGGGFSLSLPEGAKSGLAVVWHSPRGIPERASLVAHSTESLQGRSLRLWKDSVVVVGSFTSVIQLEGVEYRASEGFEGPVLFAYPLGEGAVAPWVVENDSHTDFRTSDDFVTFDGGCAVLTGVQGGRSARLERSGQRLAVFEGGEAWTLATHIGLMPSCFNAVTVVRELRSADGGIGAVTHRGRDGARLLLAGTSTAQLELVSGATVDRLTDISTPHMFLLDVTRDEVEVLASVLDSSLGTDFAIPMGIGHLDGRSALAVPVVGKGEVFIGGEKAPVRDNPANPSDTYPRAVALAVGVSGELGMQVAEFSSKTPLFERVIPFADGLITVGLSNDINSQPFAQGVVAASYDPLGKAWTQNICVSDGLRPVLSQERTDRVFLESVYGTRGLYAAGTIIGGCRLGGAKTLDVPERTSAGFIVRINSEDGIGCE